LIQAGQNSTKVSYACGHISSVAVNKSVFLQYSGLIYASFSCFSSWHKLLTYLLVNSQNTLILLPLSVTVVWI